MATAVAASEAAGRAPGRARGLLSRDRRRTHGVHVWTRSLLFLTEHFPSYFSPCMPGCSLGRQSAATRLAERNTRRMMMVGRQYVLS